MNEKKEVQETNIRLILKKSDDKKRIVYGKKKKVIVLEKEQEELAWDHSEGEVKPNWESDTDEEEIESDFEIVKNDIKDNETPDSNDEENNIIVAKSKATQDTVESDSKSSDSEENSDASSSNEELTATQKQALLHKEEAAKRKQLKHVEALALRSKTNLRSPIGCILGHGKLIFHNLINNSGHW